MESTFKALQLNIFDILSYFLPGFIFTLVIISITQVNGIKVIENNILYVIIASYLIGNIIHSFSAIPQNLLWKYYHKNKECDAKGHGIDTPKTFKGKVCKFIRYKVLDFEEKSKLPQHAKDLLLTKYPSEHKLTDLDLYKLRETAFIANKDISGYFEYLNYQKVFCGSMSFISLVFAFLFPLYALIDDLGFAITANTKLDFEFISIVSSIFASVLWWVFLRRSIFFKNYRDSIMHSNIILNFNKQNEHIKI